ncbi:hypothetical protein BU204_23175 [Actinophytocola xanthii]|uniref:Uncharacterized protein n=1 Tax=Actinophytocola xanthii TaxID=1912961 RepID=A0A1Q8CLJ7_9PSEU|nr:hypothetical protein BU204_23175 [Actinophytocola xanthii]
MTEQDGPGDVRRKVAATLERCAAALPPDLRLALMAGYGLLPEARLPRYEDRVRWVADRLGHVPRTARRRVDDAVQHVAEQLYRVSAGEDVPPPAAWHTTDLRVLVALDGPRPEVVEQRRVVAHASGLDELDLAVTLSRRDRSIPPAPEVSVLHGGVLRWRRRESSERLGFALRLPEPLAPGGVHSFGLRYVFPGERMFRPYLACVPRRACDLFDLRVRFAPGREPARVQLLRAGFQRDVDDDESPGDEVPVDPSGAVHVRFRGLAPGLAYGLRWGRG